jgi:hypothetical protein
MLKRLVELLDVLGGATRPSTPPTPTRAVLRGLWWFALFLLIWAFSGAKTKFIYVDF